MRKFIIILLFFPFLLVSQEAKFEIKSNKINLIVGEPTELQLKLKVSANSLIDSVNFELSEIGDTMGNNWELWDKGDLEKSSQQEEDGNYSINYSQKYTIANFDTGQFVFPPCIAVFDSNKIFSNSLVFTIKLEEIDEKNFIKNIKPIKEISISWYEYLFFFVKKYGLLIVISLLLIVLILYLIKKFNKKTIEKKKEPQIPTEIILLERLVVIENKKYWENSFFKKYYSELSNVLWKFLEYRYQIKTFEKTSGEILESLKWSNIPINYLTTIERFFTISDGVKFAKYKPLEKDNITAIQTIRNLIEEERLDLIKQEPEIDKKDE